MGENRGNTGEAVEEVEDNARILQISLAPIAVELSRQPLRLNENRACSGKGRTACFGIVNTRRSVASGFAAHNIHRPHLYKMLLDFGVTHVPIQWNAIQVNQNYQCKKHRDSGNVGISFIVAFGTYAGGNLRVYQQTRYGETATDYNIRHRPVTGIFSHFEHEVLPFTGDRFSLVYYKSTNLPLVIIGKCTMYTNLGVLLNAIDSYDDALDCHQKALAIALATSDCAGKHAALLNLENTYTDLCMFDTAAICRQALEENMRDEAGGGDA